MCVRSIFFLFCDPMVNDLYLFANPPPLPALCAGVVLFPTSATIACCVVDGCRMLHFSASARLFFSSPAPPPTTTNSLLSLSFLSIRLYARAHTNSHSQSHVIFPRFPSFARCPISALPFPIRIQAVEKQRLDVTNPTRRAAPSWWPGRRLLAI